MGVRQNSSRLGSEGEGVIAGGMIVEEVFPEFVEASAAVDAAEGKVVFGSGLGSEHAGLFAAGSDDGLASGLHHS